MHNIFEAKTYPNLAILFKLTGVAIITVGAYIQSAYHHYANFVGKSSHRIQRIFVIVAETTKYKTVQNNFSNTKSDHILIFGKSFPQAKTFGRPQSC